MKKTLIVRHAKATLNFKGLKDFDRTLDVKGQKDAEMMANQLINNNFIPDYIISSGAKRALSTSAIIASVIGYENKKIEVIDSIYTSTCDEIIDIIRGVSNKYNKLMIVGHNPTFHFLCQLLSGENIMRFPTCSMFCLKFDIESWSFIDKGKKEFMIFPELFR